MKVTRTQSRKFIAVGRNEETARKHLVAQKVVLLRKFSIRILENIAERKIEVNKSASRRIKSDLVVVKEEIEARRQEKHKNHVLSGKELALVEGNNFIVVNLPEDMVAVFGAERFEFVKRVEIEQGFVDVDKVVWQVMRMVERRQQVIIAAKIGGNWH